jgi:hypothetical protein
MLSRTLSSIGAIVAALAAGSAFVTAQSTQEIPKDLIAEQIRKQGHMCEKPESAVRDAERSRPNGIVWVLKCEKATYRVKLIPDMAADVQLVN